MENKNDVVKVNVFSKLITLIIQVKHTFPHEFDAYAPISKMNKYALAIRVYCTINKGIILKITLHIM